MSQKATVIVPVANVRSEPKEFSITDFSYNLERETQLLYGEQVNVIEKQGDWIRIESLEQPVYTEEKGWHFYPGWIRKSEVVYHEAPAPANCAVIVPWLLLPPLPFPVSYGTLLHQDSQGKILLPTGEKATCDPTSIRQLPCPFSRALYLKEAKQFIGMPYLWGGRASYDPYLISSVDCSSLIQLLYRTQGIHIPRDAHDQFLKATPIQATEMQMGDLIYLARLENPKRMTHLILYTGEMTFLEAPRSGKFVRVLRILSPLEEIIQLEDRDFPYLAFYTKLI